LKTARATYFCSTSHRNPPGIFSTIRHCSTDTFKSFSQNVSQQIWEKNIEIYRHKVEHGLLFFSTSDISLEVLSGEQVSNVLAALFTKHNWAVIANVSAMRFKNAVMLGVLMFLSRLNEAYLSVLDDNIQ